MGLARPHSVATIPAPPFSVPAVTEASVVIFAVASWGIPILLQLMAQCEERGMEFNAAVERVLAGKLCLLHEPFDLDCTWTLAPWKSATCPVSGTCAHMCELVSCLDCRLLVIRRLNVSPNK